MMVLLNYTHMVWVRDYGVKSLNCELHFSLFTIQDFDIFPYTIFPLFIFPDNANVGCLLRTKKIQ